MAIKKSDLYSSIWASCDELRGGMDASQYKDYVLFMLFIRYVTDKYGNSTDFAPPVTIPKGASFKDMYYTHHRSLPSTSGLSRNLRITGPRTKQGKVARVYSPSGDRSTPHS